MARATDETADGHGAPSPGATPERAAQQGTDIVLREDMTVPRGIAERAVRAGLRALQGVAPGAAARVAGRLFRTPRRFPLPEREERWLASATRLEVPYVAPPGADRDAPRTLAAWSWGAGPAVLLLHGWGGRGGQMGAFAAPLVARGLRAVALDAPAHGASGGRCSSLPEFTAALLGAAEAVGPLRGVVGHSFGTAATCLALRQGLAVERLVFVAAPLDLDVYIRLFLRALDLGEALHDPLLRLYERRFGLLWEDVRHVTTDTPFPVPLLVLHDTEDVETSFAGGEAIAHAWPHATFQATSGLGHRRILRDRTVVERVARFLGEQDEEAAPATPPERPPVEEPGRKP